ncbi:hypothetical protein KY290_028019 [Solanum tuberosum]|uniref:Retroviral polymerase SH3-like domain-containing protein n=1 Tax=Solanum tuberosum TaxID=4113 RepID=A0ABQ7UGR9_SOLTU|nr:hypothetical protein KY285_026999 [Solanum tuberosum]KAH0748787.1 hypothetical protein KY290_028019 [Solanum tuberosum]
MAKDNNISTASGSLGIELIATTQTSFPNIPLPSPNLAHQLPIPDQFLTGDQPNPAYHGWIRQDQQTTRNAWSKLVAAYASGSKPQIPPTTQFTHSSVAHNRGRGKGRGNRGRGLSSNQVYSQMAHNSGKGRIARVCPSPRICNRTQSFGKPVSNLANTQPSPTQDLLMDSGTTHHTTTDHNNLGIHSEYQGPEEVTLGNGSKLPISHIGYSKIHKGYKCFDPTSSKFFVSLHVMFYECVFPFSSRDAMVPETSTNATTDPLTLHPPVTSPPLVLPTSQPHSPSSQISSTPTTTSRTSQPSPLHLSANEISPCVDLSKCDLPIVPFDYIPSPLPSTPTR